MGKEVLDIEGYLNPNIVVVKFTSRENTMRSEVLDQESFATSSMNTESNRTRTGRFYETITLGLENLSMLSLNI